MKMTKTKKIFRSWVIVAFSNDSIFAVAKGGQIKQLDQELNLTRSIGLTLNFEIRAFEVNASFIGIGGRDKKITVYTNDGDEVLVSCLEKDVI